MDIDTIYKKYNYPGKAKLYTLAKKEGLNVTLKSVEQFLNKQAGQQIFTKKVQRKPGHIVAFEPDARVQADLIDVSNFAQQNAGYKFILLLVDVFTRKLYAYLMKSKTEQSIEEALKMFFKNHQPTVLTTDNEAAIAGKTIQQLMERNKVISDMVEVGDHKALSVIDRAVQTVKNAILKYMKVEDTPKYHKHLPEIIEAYNESPHSGILEIAPNDADRKENVIALQILNHKKDKQNRKHHIEFKPGDTVRVAVKRGPFARSYDEKYSDAQHTVEKVEDGMATLDDGKQYSVRRLIKTERVVIPVRAEKLVAAKKETRNRKKVAREDLEIESKEFEKPVEKSRKATEDRNRALKSSDVKGLPARTRFA
jgi:hypothetical protein